MNVLLRERECNAFLVKAFLDRFGQVKFDAPVIAGLDPRTNNKVDTAVCQFCDGNSAGRIIEYPVIRRDQVLESSTNLVQVIVLADADDHIDAALVIS